MSKLLQECIERWTSGYGPKNTKYQVVVFARGGVVRSVAIRDLPEGEAQCIGVDYDDAGDTPPEDYVRQTLGVSLDEFDKTATYVQRERHG